VTAQVRSLVVDHERLMIDCSLNAIFGDPFPDENKALVIHYSCNGVPGECTCLEGGTVNLDARRYDDFRPRRASVQASAALIRRDSNVDDRFPLSALVLSTPDVVRLVASFLPIYPDRLQSMRVARVWRDVMVADGLTDSFVVGLRGYAGKPCYLHMPISFHRMVLRRSEGHLRELDLSYFEPLTDDVVISALRANRGLRTLDLSGCVQLTQESLSLIGTCCPKLRSLSLKRLSEVDDSVVSCIARHCQGLEIFNLSDCCNVTNAGLEEMQGGLFNLREFHTKDLYKVTDAAIGPVLSSCGPKLQALSLWGMHQISAESLVAMGRGGLPNLASLNLWGCYLLDDDAISSSLCHCTELVDLNLRDLYQLTDEGLICIAQNLRKLEHLDLQCMRDITDEAILCIALQLLSLRSLNLTHCTSLSESGEALATLCQSLNQLTELRLAYGPGYSDATVERIAQALKHRSAEFAQIELLDMRGNELVTPACTQLLSETLNKTFVENPLQVFVTVIEPTGPTA